MIPRIQLNMGGLEGPPCPRDRAARGEDRGGHQRATPPSPRRSRWWRPAWTASHHARLSRYQRTVSRDPRLEVVRRPPAQLAPDLARVDGVAAIVTRPVGHERLEGVVPSRGWDGEGGIRRGRQRGLQRGTETVHHVEIRPLARAPDVVLLPHAPLLQHEQEPRAVVLHVEPVAHLAAVAVDGQRPPLHRVQDHQGDELLGKLARPVVVRAVGEERGQAVRHVVGAHQMVGAGLGRRVGRVRGVRRLLREGPGRPEAAVDLVRGDVQEAEARGARPPVDPPRRRARPPAARRSPRGSCRRRRRGPSIDRSTCVSAARFTTAVGAWLRNTASIAARSAMSACTKVSRGSSQHAVEVVQVARVGELVDDDQARAGARERDAHEVGADEPGPAGDDDGLAHGPATSISGGRAPAVDSAPMSRDGRGPPPGPRRSPRPPTSGSPGVRTPPRRFRSWPRRRGRTGARGRRGAGSPSGRCSARGRAAPCGASAPAAPPPASPPPSRMASAVSSRS